MNNSSDFKLYLILFMELIFLPFLYIFEYIKRFQVLSKNISIRSRLPIIDNSHVYYHVHEWGGYPAIRKKKIKNRGIFKCGLEAQLARIEGYVGKYSIISTLTMSDSELCKNINSIKSRVNKFLLVDNAGMDFSGYSSFYESIKNSPNAYVILSNTSVNSLQNNFIDSYISIMNSDSNIGILGISYCTKCYQSLIRNNFSPHLQSFFYLTTIDVLREIVQFNGGQFPGNGIQNKLLLIRNGEIKISQIALNLGYSLAVVLENSVVYKFDSKSTINTWTIYQGDLRQHVSNPNAINVI